MSLELKLGVVVRAALTASLLSAAAGCADAPRDSDDDDGSGGSTGAFVGSGGASTTTTGMGGASTTTGMGGGDATTTTTSTGPSPCEQWPAGPYGVGTGQTVHSFISWQGYAPGSSTPGPVSIHDLFDCDGTHGIDAILFDTSQFG